MNYGIIKVGGVKILGTVANKMISGVDYGIIKVGGVKILGTVANKMKTNKVV